jgi:multidrug efflux pump subunit AcrA (membrane-fusion protein)
MKPFFTSKTVIVAMLVVWAVFNTSCEKKPKAATEKSPIVQGLRIEKIALAPTEDFYEATGTVQAKSTTTISSKIMGSVLALRVRQGEGVRAGQMLIEIDSRDAAAQLQKAQAGFREAQQAVSEAEQAISAAEAAKASAEANRKFAAATFARFQALLERKAISPQEFDEAKAKYQVAEAETARADKMIQTFAAKKNQALAKIDQAKADITTAQIYAGYGRIVSPINGIVTTKQIEVGAMAAPGTPLLTIEDNSQYRLEAAVEESQLGRVHMQETVQVRIDALGDEELAGKVVEIVPTADAASRSYIVKIDLPATSLLRSGLYGKARFTTGQKQALTIPQKAIVQQGQLAGVYVVDESGIAHLRFIKTGKMHGDQIEVLSGISDGDRVVVEGLANLSDGSRVQ